MTNFLYGIVAVFCLLLSSAVAQEAKPSKNSKPSVYKCVAGPDEKCASDLWMADYEKLIALQKKYAAPQDVIDMMSGLRMRLSQQVPAGFGWDDEKKRFVKLPEAPKPPEAVKK